MVSGTWGKVNSAAPLHLQPLFLNERVKEEIGYSAVVGAGFHRGEHHDNRGRKFKSPIHPKRPYLWPNRVV